MKRVVFLIGFLAFLTTSAYPCFDTYLFLRKGSMVYPFRSLVFELNGEYSFNSFSNPQNDMFFAMGSIYYGLARNFSIQLTFGSDEKYRGEFKFDYYGIRGVYNIYSSFANRYTLDLIVEHRGNLVERRAEMEVSAPSIFHLGNFTYVVHPTASYGLQSKDLTVGGHVGAFYTFSEAGVIGLGAEYASVHSSSYGGRRLTQSEYSASIFFGAKIGDRIFIQNEIAKGLKNSRDLGFAVTTKFIL